MLMKHIHKYVKLSRNVMDIEEKNMRHYRPILETLLVQREYDGRWEKLIKVLDYENSYVYNNEHGIRVTYTPEKWLVSEVFDFIMQEGTVSQ